MQVSCGKNRISLPSVGSSDGLTIGVLLLQVRSATNPLAKGGPNKGSRYDPILRNVLVREAADQHVRRTDAGRSSARAEGANQEASDALIGGMCVSLWMGSMD